MAYRSNDGSRGRALGLLDVPPSPPSNVNTTTSAPPPRLPFVGFQLPRPAGVPSSAPAASNLDARRPSPSGSFALRPPSMLSSSPAPPTTGAVASGSGSGPQLSRWDQQPAAPLSSGASSTSHARHPIPARRDGTPPSHATYGTPSRQDVRSSADASSQQSWSAPRPPAGPSQPHVNGRPAPSAPPSGPRGASTSSSGPMAVPTGPRGSGYAPRPMSSFPPVPPPHYHDPSQRPSNPSPNHSRHPLPAAHIPPDFFKPLGTRDFRVMYDPSLDPSPVKRGKEVIRRYDGEDLGAVVDPRLDKARSASRSDRGRSRLMKSLAVVSYEWDRQSTGPPPPPPPSAILVTGFPGSTTPDQIHRQFTTYGRIETQDNKIDVKTGGSLGICWIRFVDNAPRSPDADRATKDKFKRDFAKGAAQDGHAVALEALAKGNGSKIGSKMMMQSGGVKVVMDGEGKLCAAAVKLEMARRHPVAPPPPPPPPSLPAAVPQIPRPGPPTSSPFPPPPGPPQLHPTRLQQLSRPMQPSAPPPPPPLPPSGPRAMRGIPPPTEPYKPIVFSGVYSHKVRPVFDPSNIAAPPPPPRILPTIPSPGKRTTTGRDTFGNAGAMSMSAAVAAAIKLAKKRVVDVEKEKAKREDEGDDMELDSDESHSDSDAEGKEDKVFFHRGGQGQPDKPPGSVPIAWQASPQLLREQLMSNGFPYLSIIKATYYAVRAVHTVNRGRPAMLDGQELEDFFAGYDVAKSFSDTAGWYITFNSPTAGLRAFKALDRKPFASAPLQLVLSNPPIAITTEARLASERTAALDEIAAMNQTREKKTSGWTDAELIDEARDIVIKDLIEIFKKDVKTRLVSNKVTELLAVWEAGGGSKAVASTSNGLVKSESLDTSSMEVQTKEAPTIKSISSLPSFARRKPGQRPPVVSRLSSEAPSDPRGTPIDHSDSESRPKPSKARRDSSSKKSSRPTAQDSESDDSSTFVEPRPRLTKKGQRLKAQTSYTSSEGEDSDTNATPPSRVAFSPPAAVDVRASSPEVAPPPVKVVKVKAEPLKKRSHKKKVEEVVRRPSIVPDVPAVTEVVDTPIPPAAPIVVEVTPEPEPEPVVDITAVQIARGRQLAKDSKRERGRSLTPDPFARGIAADAEDLYFIKLAIERPRRGLPLHPTPPPSDDDEPRHPTGAARTEGHYPISVAEKIANRPSSNKAKAALEAGGASGVSVSRLARANTRGLVRGMELHKKTTATDTDVLKFNQLRTRKKQLTFSRSGIEGYGLFAKELIPAGEMVIEYVGELVRQQVADRREKAYERQGIGSSYLFRVDEDLVVDATKKGNLGRLINHCCAPNCTARIITINGEKKIVIYAKTNIEPGDEVTYDYHFPHEEVKIPCLCAHVLCRRYLN